MIRYSNFYSSRRSKFKRLPIFKILAALILLLIILTQVLNFYFEFHYNAVPSFIQRRLFSPPDSKDLLTPGIHNPLPKLTISQDQSSQLIKYQELYHQLTSPKSGFPKILCGCYKENNELTAQDLETLSRRIEPSQSSTCSAEASHYANHQKVISYTLFVPDEESAYFFLDGIRPNLEKIQTLFPHWLVRIYTNIPPNKFSCPFICDFKFVHWCDITNLPLLGDESKMNVRVWRFLVVGDPLVNLFLVRDLDSLSSERERIIVREWEWSNASIHVIRDSQWHDTEILAGLWGMKNYAFSTSELSYIQSGIIKGGKKNSDKFLDQDLAAKYIYFPYKTDVLAHDSYYCDKYKGPITHPFPSQRLGEEFVGHDDRKEMNSLFTGRLRECPIGCRPKYGKDWKYC